MQIIIYNDENGQMHRIRPTEEFLSQFTIEDCAQKDVPAPKKIYDVPTGQYDTDPETGEQYEVMDFRVFEYRYKIIDDSELPENWHERDAWEVVDSELTDGVGAEWSTMDEVGNG